MTNREYMHGLSDIELIKWVQSKPWDEYTYYGFWEGFGTEDEHISEWLDREMER